MQEEIADEENKLQKVENVEDEYANEVDFEVDEPIVDTKLP